MRAPRRIGFIVVRIEEGWDVPAVRHHVRPRIRKAADIERADETKSRLVAADPLDRREMLTGIAKIEHDLGTQRVIDGDVDERAASGDIAKAHRIAVVRVVDLAFPDQRMALFIAIADPLRLSRALPRGAVLRDELRPESCAG